MKIAIIGYSGSGKSSLARTLAAHDHIPILHLDQVNFTDNWTQRPIEESKAIVSKMLDRSDWIIEGNYNELLYEQRMEKADQIIFMNFPRRICLPRVIKRYHQYKGNVRPDMSSGCEEKLDLEFIYWVLYRGRNKRKRMAYQKLCEQYKEKTIILCNQKALDTYIQHLLR